MKRLLASLAALGMVCALGAPAAAYESFHGPLGVLTNNKGVTDGYVLLAPQHSKKTYLIDNEGNVVKEWLSEYKAFYAELLPNGNMIRMSRFEPVMLVNFGGVGGIMEEFDWEGNKVWESVICEEGKEVSHHTFEVMPNGNYLVLVWEYKSYEEALAAGLDPEKPGRSIFPDGMRVPSGEQIMGIWPDFIVEIDRQTGNRVWEWHVWDHLGSGPDKIDINAFIPPEADRIYAGPDWTHLNGLAYDPKTDRICVTSRNLGEVYVIDRKTGNITFRWGNPANYGQGRLPSGYSQDGDQKLFGPHAPDWTPQGTISILDNGNNRPSGNYTRAVELDPATGKVVWEWGPRSVKATGGNFYSAYQCGAQKLANGNWMITSSDDGHVIEVTPDKHIVWELANPIRLDVVYKTSSFNGTGGGSIHKALRYEPGFAGFKGKTLKPLYALPNWTQLLAGDPAPTKPL